MEDVLFLIGRIIVGGFYLVMGSNHFMKLKDMAGYAQMKGVPMPTAATLGTGTVLLLGGASIVTGFQPVIGVVLLATFLIVTAFKMHDFWAVDDAQMKMMEMTQFMKDLALAGSVLMFLAIPRAWELAIG